jgi:hypothetical protein
MLAAMYALIAAVDMLDPAQVWAFTSVFPFAPRNTTPHI